MRLLETDSASICALATAHGKGAISVIRISGVQAVEITRKVAAFLPYQLESHKIYYGILKTPDTLQPLDEVLVSYFEKGRSFTGETTLEISCHGSDTIVNEILRSLILSGARPAERGEFTYRAFMNGRLDLVQAESVLAMIESGSPRAARMALRQLQGGVSKRLHGILERLTWVLANLEANIDFAAEDIVIADSRELVSRVTLGLQETEDLLKSYTQGRILREGFVVALVGRPNVGKSSLLNLFAGEERAIVTPVAGTTRDFVETQLIVNGVRTTIVDTAGLRVTDDPVERIGVQRTLEKLPNVDLVFYVTDAQTGLIEEEAQFLERLPWGKTAILVNKLDLCGEFSTEKMNLALKVLPVSAKELTGFEEVRAFLSERLRLEAGEDTTLVSNARHFQQLQVLREALLTSLPLLERGDSPDLIALELQTGIRALYEILGMVYDDQVMDRVFAEFCLGK